MFPTTAAWDLWQFVAGEKLGEGIGREVYEFSGDKSMVIKVESSGFQNIKEWEIWNEMKHWKGKLAEPPKWLAPCISISTCGIYLVQERTYSIPKEEYPEKVPAFLLDRKYGNFGVIMKDGKRQFVCHDYGMQSLCNGVKMNLVNAEWTE